MSYIIAVHLCTCPMRVMSCEPGMRSCDRLLHKWLYREEKPAEHDDAASDSLLGDDDELTGFKMLPSQGGSGSPMSGSKLVSLAGSHVLDVGADNVTLNTYHNSLAQQQETHENQPGQSFLPLFTAGQGEEVAPEATLFATDGFAIEFSKKQTFFQSVRIKKPALAATHGPPHGAQSSDDNDQRASTAGGSHTASTTSVYYDGFTMRLHREVRMYCCRRHRVTLVAAAVRYDDFALAEYVVKQVKECEDIDCENVSGDTALTLACRLGRLPFVELLLQHGADVNKETFNGKTGEILSVKM